MGTLGGNRRFLTGKIQVEAFYFYHMTISRPPREVKEIPQILSE